VQYQFLSPMFRVNLSSYQFTYLFSFFSNDCFTFVRRVIYSFFQISFCNNVSFSSFQLLHKKTFRAGVKLTQNTNQYIPPPSTPPNSFLKTYLTFSTILFYGPPKNMFCSHSSQKKFSLNKLVVFIENNRRRSVYLFTGKQN